MSARYYEKTYNRVRADGTVYVVTHKQKYTVRPDHCNITEDIQQKIKEQHAIGAPATKIASNIGISAYRVRQYIKTL